MSTYKECEFCSMTNLQRADVEEVSGNVVEQADYLHSQDVWTEAIEHRPWCPDHPLILVLERVAKALEIKYGFTL